MEKTFCGDCVLVTYLDKVDTSRAFFFGELRSEEVASYSKGDKCQAKLVDSNLFFLGKLVFSTDSESRFVIHPIRKWKFKPREHDKNERFVFNVYLVIDDIVMEVAKSIPFTVIQGIPKVHPNEKIPKEESNESRNEASLALDGQSRSHIHQLESVKKVKIDRSQSLLSNSYLPLLATNPYHSSGFLPTMTHSNKEYPSHFPSPVGNLALVAPFPSLSTQYTPYPIQAIPNGRYVVSSMPTTQCMNPSLFGQPYQSSLVQATVAQPALPSFSNIYNSSAYHPQTVSLNFIVTTSQAPTVNFQAQQYQYPCL